MIKKMKQKYIFVLNAVLALAVFSFSASAQSEYKSVSMQQKEHILVTAETDSASITNLETLSGIHLHHVKKGMFALDFTQELKENAMLEIKNKAGRRVYYKPVSIADNKSSWTYNVGKLKPDTYTVEVKTSDTTYWTQFKIGN